MNSYDLFLSGNHPVDDQLGDLFHTVLNILAIILETNKQTKKAPLPTQFWFVQYTTHSKKDQTENLIWKCEKHNSELFVIWNEKTV